MSQLWISIPVEICVVCCLLLCQVSFQLCSSFQLRSSHVRCSPFSLSSDESIFACGGYLGIEEKVCFRSIQHTPFQKHEFFFGYFQQIDSDPCERKSTGTQYRVLFKADSRRCFCKCYIGSDAIFCHVLHILDSTSRFQNQFTKSCFYAETGKALLV